ncbi:F-box protein At3g12350 isoform X1 [Neltuma alba]|uniref:F-box protein At3g12350-like isoform X1 n=1 Tax=Neltuma alba TaxID=207710 RepID=UPI0010A3C612|nr:F-box protein At3g12350-like isoform X1 [Prosopis alba]XP_028806866.1 F-box protein At3g12350-like isoform X1 [Prosopis alba]
MANLEDPNFTENEGGSISFTDFPEDVQLCILSFLTPSDIATFACTSKRFGSLFSNDSKLWFSLCDRKWGSKTQITKWGNGKISYRLLYKTLNEWENLIGFWRRSGPGSIAIASPSLVIFEWGQSFLAGSRVSPSKTGTYDILKSPFLRMSLSSEGQVLNFLDPDGQTEMSGNFEISGQFDMPDNELIPVNVSFMGKTHFVVEENQNLTHFSSPDQRKHGFRRSSSSTNLSSDYCTVGEDVVGADSGSPGSLPDRLMSDIYQHFANRTSPGSDKSRKQRRREKERLARRKWEPEHFVKIVNCAPTPSRPLQGLWKGIGGDRSLAFYLVAYDDIGGVACRQVGNLTGRFPSHSPVFWTTNATFVESPFSPEEEYLYDTRIHLRPLEAASEIHHCFPLTENEVVNGILHISSSYELIIPDLARTVNTRSAEGRIWRYQNGTFGFGFVRDNFIVDLKRIAYDDCV